MEDTLHLHEGGHGGFHLDKKHLMILGVVAVAVLGFFMSKRATTPSTNTDASTGLNPTSTFTAPIYTGYDGTAPVLTTVTDTGPSGSAPSAPGGTILTPAPQPSNPVTIPVAPTTPPPAAPIGTYTPGASIPLPTYVNPTNDPTVARQAITNINTYMAAAAAQGQVTQPMTNQLHQQKVAAAGAIGESVDSWGIARNGTGAIDFSTSSGLTVQSINAYTTANAGKISAQNLAQLHQQKVQYEASLGNTVDASGNVFNAQGKPVGANGRG